MPQGVEYALTYAHTDEPPEPRLSPSTGGRVAVERPLPCN